MVGFKNVLQSELQTQNDLTNPNLLDSTAEIFSSV